MHYQKTHSRLMEYLREPLHSFTSGIGIPAYMLSRTDQNGTEWEICSIDMFLVQASLLPGTARNGKSMLLVKGSLYSKQNGTERSGSVRR